MNNDIIYVTGDSYTAGEDLSDYIIKPDFIGYNLKDYEYYSINTNKKINLLKEWNKIKFNFSNYDHTAVIRNNLKKRWSTHLSNLIGISVYNNSEGGIAIDNCLYRTVLDISYFKSCGINVKEVIFQITHPARFTYFDTHKDSSFYSNSNPNMFYTIEPELKWHKVCKGDNNVNYKEKKFFEQSILLQDYGSLTYKALMLFKIYENTVKGLIQKSPIFVDSIFWKNNYTNYKEEIENIVKENKNWRKDFILNNYAQDFYDNLKLDMWDCILNKEEKVFTANFHLNEIIHERFAEKIANTYF